METVTTVLFVLLGAALLGGLGYVAVWLLYVLPKQRSNRLAAFAADHGWRYVEEDPSLVDRWSGEPFGRGYDRWTGNVVSGAFEARDIISFDYGYSTRDSRDNSETVHRYGVLAMRMPGSLPPLRVAPEGLVDDMVETLGVGAVARELGYADIRFESGQFNNAFRVTATDERFAHAVVHPRMMEMLLFQGEIAWRFEGDTIIGWWGEERGKHEAADVIRRLDLLRWVLDLVPPYVWKDYAGVDPRPGLA